MTRYKYITIEFTRLDIKYISFKIISMGNIGRVTESKSIFKLKLKHVDF